MPDIATASSLILTKLHPPRVSRELVHRPRLLEQLTAPGALTLVIAPAGYGKTTLLSEWLATCALPSAWLSLDAQDSDLITFATYLVAAVRTLFPEAGAEMLELLNGVTQPPPAVISRSLLNALDEIQQEFILILDDYHVIRDSRVHGLLAELTRQPPQPLHLVVAARSDPQLPLSALRARGHVTELRAADLRFTLEEADRFLRRGMRLQVDDRDVAILRTRSEGWAAGLRLAALYYRHTGQLNALALDRPGSNRYIMDYLVAEVLSQLPLALQKFLVKTSILDRLCSPLCEALIGVDDPERSERSERNGQAYLEWLEQADLFLTPLSDQQDWYRYHPLFRQLLQDQLRLKHSPTEIAALHQRASAWLAENDYIEEALQHALAGGDIAAAVRLVTQQRRALMDAEQWQRLDRWLRLLPREVIDQQPELLLAEVWLLLNRHQVDAVSPVLDRVEALLAQPPLDAATADRLQGEVAIRRSTQYYYAADTARSFAAAQQALQQIPPDWQQLRSQARLFASGGYLVMGDRARAYATLYDSDGGDASRGFQIRMFANAGFIHWIAADLAGLARSANQTLALGSQSNQLESIGLARYFVGIFHYERNELAAAEQHLLPIILQPYRAHMMVFLNSAAAQALIYQAQRQPEKAREIAGVMSSIAFGIHSANLIFTAQAFQAELALRQGRLAEAGEWAKQVDVRPSPMPWFYAPHVTLVRILLAQDTPDSRQRARQVLDQLRHYFTSIHYTRSLIEILALQALLHHAAGCEQDALAALRHSIDLAEPGGIIRFFVDLGAPLQRLLAALIRTQSLSPYAQEILAAFPAASDDAPATGAPPDAASAVAARRRANDALLSPLTGRELEVLALLDKRYTDKEIADTLVISLSTVRSHIEHLGDKLGARGRRAVVQTSRDQGLL